MTSSQTQTITCNDCGFTVGLFVIEDVLNQHYKVCPGKKDRKRLEELQEAISDIFELSRRGNNDR